MANFSLLLIKICIFSNALRAPKRIYYILYLWLFFRTEGYAIRVEQPDPLTCAQYLRLGIGWYQIEGIDLNNSISNSIETSPVKQ